MLSILLVPFHQQLLHLFSLFFYPFPHHIRLVLWFPLFYYQYLRLGHYYYYYYLLLFHFLVPHPFELIVVVFFLLEQQLAFVLFLYTFLEFLLLISFLLLDKLD